MCHGSEGCGIAIQPLEKFRYLEMLDVLVEYHSEQTEDAHVLDVAAEDPDTWFVAMDGPANILHVCKLLFGTNMWNSLKAGSHGKT